MRLLAYPPALQLALAICLSTLAIFFSATATRANVTGFTLENGLEVVVIPDNRAPVTTHMLWYKVGAADEPPGVSGVAHYLEHLLFKGTETYPKGVFRDIVRGNGGTDNAFTSYDYTAYFQRIATDRLGDVMALEADRMRNIVLTDEDIATERQVVIEERAGRVDSNPGGLFGEQRRAALFLNHPYGRPIIGWRHEMLSLGRDDALAFYERYYAPNNAILIVAGNVTEDEVRALAETHYGPLKPTPDLPVRIRPAEPPHLSARRMEYRDARVRQPYLVRSYLAPARKTGDQAQAAALVFLADLLGGGVTSHLTRTLQLDEGIALAAGSFYGPTAYDMATFGLYVTPSPEVSLQDAEARLDAAIAAFIEAGPDPQEMARIKTGIRAREVYALDSQQGRANAYGRALTSGLTIADVEAWQDVLQAVTADDIIAVAREVLIPTTSVTGYLLGTEETN